MTMTYSKVISRRGSQLPVIERNPLGHPAALVEVAQHHEKLVTCRRGCGGARYGRDRTWRPSSDKGREKPLVGDP